ALTGRRSIMNYSGIDLHSNNSVVSVIDETDRVVAEKRLPNEPAKILTFVAPWQVELAGVVIESTYSQRISNGKKKGEGNTKNGNPYLSWAFIEVANFALRYCAEAKRFYERKKGTTNTILARRALAHKLAHACFHMLKEHKPFDMTSCFA
ncbi:hypothetical protein PQR07_36880, partial [Paraburkholderia aspalathi]